MNEPYQRVSQGNGDITGMLTGAAIGTGLGGGALLGLRHTYNNAESLIGKYNKQLDKGMAKMDGILNERQALHDQLVNSGAPQAEIDQAAKKLGSATRNMEFLKSDKQYYTKDGVVDELKGYHPYKHMNGWKKAGLVAGGTLLGGALGYAVSGD